MSNDAISRAALLAEMHSRYAEVTDFEHMVEQAPTIEPQMVHCGECRYFCADHPSGETCLNVHGMCQPDEGDHCSLFETRMDAEEESTNAE